MVIGYKKNGFIVYVSLKTMYSTFEGLKKRGVVKLHRSPPGRNETGIAVVRSPYSRMESFYKDKMIKAMNPELRQSCQKFLAKVFDRQRLINRQVSFQEFILNGIGKNLIQVSRADGHLHSQCSYIPKATKHTVHMERPNELKWLSERIGADLSEFRANSTSDVSVDLTWTPEMRRIVYRAYREDFERFGYSA